MFGRDYIINQIEQAAQVIGVVIASFLGLKTRGSVVQAIQISNEQLKSELDLDVDELLSMSKDEMKAYLQGKKMIPEHFDALSQYLLEVGESLIETNKNDAKQYLTKALELLHVADEISKTLSFEREDRKTAIERILLTV